MKTLLAPTALAVVTLLAACGAEESSPKAVQNPYSTACAVNGIGNPAEFVWTYHPTGDYYSGVLEVSEATFDIDGETLTTRAYRQPGQPHSIPGPTITMVPGNKYVLRFENRLPYEPPSTQENVLKDPNVSNVHTHGLHISGETPSDDVTRSFPGGTAGDFVYDIPADHMGGTYWYHAHHHGSTFLQVSGGTFGLLIIDDGADGLPANVAAMEERHIVLGYLDPGAAGSGGDTLLTGTLSPGWTINGRKNGSLCMPHDEWQHWRILVADRDATDKTLTFGEGCEVALLARDGVWRTTAPKALPTRSLTLTGASRADFAVRCTASSTLSVGNNTIASILVDDPGTGDPAPHPYAADGSSTWSAIRPDYLRDLSSVPQNSLNTETIRMGARTVNGSKYDHHNANLTLPAQDVQSWTLRGAGQHPFHLHVYHVQTFGCGGDFEDGEYYDVVSSNCEIRFDTDASTSTPYSGRTIMHCHILEHEDQGAMGWMNLLGGADPPTFPVDDTVDPPFSTFYELGSSCGDGSCNGTEDTCSCAADCGAPPASELICSDDADNDCDGLDDCDDPDCTSDSACACGNGSCEAGEDSCSCSADCGMPPTTELVCDDGGDADCDGLTDCEDDDCSGDAACQAGTCNNDGVCDAGEDCNTCAADCDGVTNGKPSSRYCCGDGVQDGAEGDGTICDGNY